VFPAPPVIETTIFARLPDSLRARSNPRQQSGVPRDSFLEGPSFDRAGNLYVVNIPYGQVLRVSPQGEFAVVAEWDGEPNGLKIHKDGRIFIADHKQGLMLLDPASGKVEVYLDRPRRERFKGLNDLVFARNGDLYSPTRARPICVTRPGGCFGCARTVRSTSCSATCRARTGWC